MMFGRLIDIILSDTFNIIGGISMVKHIVCWNYKDNLTKEQREDSAKKIKQGLENLIHLIDGVNSIEVKIDLLSTSSADIVLESEFVDEKALAAYQVHEEHKKVGQYIGSVTQNRYCIDYVF